MDDGPEGAAGGLFVEAVVDEAEDGLEEDEGDDDEADYGVVVAALFSIIIQLVCR